MSFLLSVPRWGHFPVLDLRENGRRSERSVDESRSINENERHNFRGSRRSNKNKRCNFRGSGRNDGKNMRLSSEREVVYISL